MIYRDKIVTIPKGKSIVINRGDGNKVLYTVSSKYDYKRGYTTYTRAIIGYVCDDSTTTMYPTDNYKQYFAGEWERLFGEKAIPYHFYCGMYSVTKAVCDKTGLKLILDDAFGKQKANAFLDYAMASIMHHTDSTLQIEYQLKNQFTFSATHHSDAFYSNLFEKEFGIDEMLIFKKGWALKCKEEGIENVALCIDGSNDDVRSKGVTIAEKGHAKSKKNCNIVSFSYAVSETGRPVTFEVYRGGLVDYKAMKRIITFLRECGIAVSLVILDRGYCNKSALAFLRQRGIKYIVMVKGKPDGFVETYNESSEKIKGNMHYWVVGTEMFATSKKVTFFKGCDYEDYVTIFYDMHSAVDRISTLMKKVNTEILALTAMLQSGEVPTIKREFSSFLCIKEVEVEEKKFEKRVCINADALQLEVNAKGIYAIVASLLLSPERIHSYYTARGGSETQYAIVKTQLGYGVMRVHFTLGVHAKFTVGFIASIIRHEFEQASKALDRSTNVMIGDINQIVIRSVNGKSYYYDHSETKRQADFLKLLGSSIEAIDEVVLEANRRLQGTAPVPRHRKPGRKPKTTHTYANLDEQGNPVRLKPGVPIGTKRGEFKKDGTPRKKPGPKPGTIFGEFNKDGTPRKKPGPKPRSASEEE